MRISDWSSDVCSSDLTACATADIPADSQVAPTINCDPASFEVEGDPTHVKELVSATPIGNGQWELVYGIDVTNTSTHATTYDLAATLHFTTQATLKSDAVTASHRKSAVKDRRVSGGVK